MDRIVAEVNAMIEINIEELINAVKREYNVDIEDITMDNIFEYVNNGMSYLENRKAKGVYMVSDGWSLCSFSDRTYDKIEKTLIEMQRDE